MGERYFMVRINEDGEVSVDVLSKAELEKKLNEKYWGDIKFFDRQPNRSDPNEWQSLGGCNALLIKGVVIQPAVVETVTKFEVP